MPSAANPSSAIPGQAIKEELHSAMIGQETTDGWDVLVSYSQEKLNGFLQKAWADCKLVATPTYQRELVVTEDYSIKFKDELSLENPTLQFVEDNEGAWAKLTMDVSGTSTVVGSDPIKKTIISRGKYRLEGTFKIVSINGDGSEAGSGNSIIHFKGSKASHYITFHWSNDHSTWKASLVPQDHDNRDEKTKNHDKALLEIISAIGNYFRTLENKTLIDLALAEISNDKHTGASDLLTPESYRLASQPGVLNVFIKTKGGYAEPPGGNRSFQLKPGKNYPPVPRDYGASIIIRRQLLIEKFLVAKIKEQASTAHLDPNDGIKVNGGVNRGTTDETGAVLEFRYNTPLWTKHKSLNLIFLQLHFQGLSIDFENNPVKLVLQDDENLEIKSKWDWSCKGTVDYYEINTAPLPRPGMRPPPTYFHPEYNVSIPGKAKPVASLHDEKISWDIKLGDDDQPQGKKGDENVTVTTDLYKFDLKLPDLDYFRATNIFAPGKHMIDAKSIMFPYDLVILGDIAKPT